MQQVNNLTFHVKYTPTYNVIITNFPLCGFKISCVIFHDVIHGWEDGLFGNKPIGFHFILIESEIYNNTDVRFHRTA